MVSDDDPKTPHFNEQDKPTKEQMDTLESAVQRILNPSQDIPQLLGYISSTFNYILETFDKVAKAEDKDAAAQEIAEDLKKKYESWIEKQDFDQAKENRGECSETSQ